MGTPPDAAPATARRLFVYNGGFVWQKRLRRMLGLAGYRLTTGRPGPGDLVGVWGNSPTAHRGETIAARTGAQVLRIEDTFLRSLHPGRRGEAPIGLMIDDLGVHFDGRAPSRVEHILANAPLDDSHLLDRARDGMGRMRAGHLTKYSAVDPTLPAPDPGYVLIVDQTAGDASLRACGATRSTFLEMIFCAREDHPGARIVVKTHPETAQGMRRGHLGADDLPEGAEIITSNISPWTLMEGAIAVYTVSSQLGFEAILAGHKPIVFGQPFYAGWGLTEDRHPIDRRQRRLTRAQLFAGAMIEAPVWYDPYRDRLGTFEDALGAIEAQTRAWRDDHRGWTAAGMRLWKRAPMQRFFGRHKRMVFADRPAPPRRHMVWGAAPAQDAVRVEDGFLRSRGLGARLVPPLSLVLDDLGIYYDPSRPSRFEQIARQTALTPMGRHRADRLIRTLRKHELSKYNQGGALPPLPDGPKLLVVGQVEDDASVRLGGGDIRSNRALLEAARAANPGAAILWKPHPDVEAGLRPGAVPDAQSLCDLELRDVDPAAVLDHVDAVWTISSLMGFEAILRDIPVTCVGAPFYAGWGLTTDLGPVPDRRDRDLSVTELAHAALIAYPRYVDPVTGLPCPVEVVVDRLIHGDGLRAAPALRVLAKLQGVFAGVSWLWR